MTKETKISSEIYGGKSYWINWLIDNEYNVPQSIFIEAMNTTQIEKFVYSSTFLKKLKIFEDCNNKKYVRIAARSSGLTEDGLKMSKAGNYNSYLDLKNIDELRDACINIVKTSKEEKMGVLIQKMVDSKLSGVIFSSNPMNTSKNEVLISYTYGLGDKLVSGSSECTDIIIKVPTENSTSKQIKDLPHIKIIDLIKIAKNIEKKLGYPVDIEWSIDKFDQLFILQCRPITSISQSENELYLIDEEIMNKVENKYLASDKVKMRLVAKKYNLTMSKGYLFIMDSRNEFAFDISKIERSNLCCGYSVVIIFPKRIDGKVIRSFIGDRENLKHTIKCQRYGIRGLPDFDDLYECLESFYEKVKNDYWKCCIIIQEILHPMYTGILKRKENNFIIEIAKGHFASKGIIPMSTYFVNDKCNILFKKEIFQEQYIEIIEGCTLDFNSLKPELVSISSKTIKCLINSFTKIINNDNVVIEFGLLKDKKSLIPYLIDISNDNNDTAVEILDAQNGVISNGTIKGQIKKIEVIDKSKAMNLHFYNKSEVEKIDTQSNIIFYAPLPSISFLEIIEKYDSRHIGFVFEKGSILCHLSVLLREKGIPAIFLPDDVIIKDKDRVILDTEASLKLRKI